jgi:tetratricopeptide (TPR) repeat protein
LILDRHRLAGWVVLLLLLAVAWRILGGALAGHWADTDATRARSWRADDASALVRASAEQRVAGHLDAASASARTAIRTDPLDGLTYRALALVAVDRGDLPQAQALMRIAQHHAPRDAFIHAWLFDRAMAAGHYDTAASEIDVMLRVAPRSLPRLAPLITGLVATAASRDAAVRMLAQPPPWRLGYWNHLCRSDQPDRVMQTLATALDRGASPLSADERRAWIERMIRDQRWSIAYPYWIGSLPADARAALANVYNGGFEQDPQDSGFGWRIGRVPGARIDLQGTSGASGTRALRVEFSGRRVPFSHVRQLLLLPPGHYLMSGKVRLDHLRSERGLQWVIDCAEGRKQRIAASDRFSGNAPWSDFATTFDVPAGQCNAQWLRLTLPARVPAERQIAGTAWFDDLRVVRERSATTPQADASPSGPSAGPATRSARSPH